MTDILSVEIKARVRSLDEARRVLEDHGARFIGEDHQVDTYFKCPEGRMKVREGTIENSIIYYRRANQAGPKDSVVLMERLLPGNVLKSILSNALAVDTVVDKRREIRFIDNVKFHLDTVLGLGTFLEIEALDETGEMGRDKLEKQCRYYMQLLTVREEDLVTVSYSDMVR